MLPFGSQSDSKVQEAKRILKLHSRGEIEEIGDSFKPFIYGGTPFFQCFETAVELMTKTEYELHEKTLLVVSDGEPRVDAGIEEVNDCNVCGMTKEKFVHLKELAKLKGIQIISCYIAKNSKVECLKLYKPRSAELYQWEEPATFLYDLSGTINSASIPLNVLTSKNWRIDDSSHVNDDKIKTFVHANSPDNMKTACQFAKDLITRKDCLHQFLDDISLKTCVNKRPVLSANTRSIKVRNQEKEDCFVHAGSVAIYLFLRLVENQEGSYPRLEDLYDRLSDHIEENPNDDEPAHETLNNFAKQYRLRVESIETKHALNPWFSKQVVIGYFRWSKPEYENFLKFYDENPTGIMKREDYAQAGESNDGHAVILARFDSSHLRLMNSWGDDSADHGFFKIQNAEVLKMQFMRVYFDKENLTESEIRYYKTYGPRNIANKLANLKGLQNSKFKCPKCHESSSVDKYGGKMFKSVCPNCDQQFDCDEPGSTLVLYRYLQSIAKYTKNSYKFA